ncbi:MAG: diacylglycerol kinase family protein [bacterium]
MSEKKYITTLNQVEARITELGLSGKICRLAPLRSLRDIVMQELRRNPKMIIAVGNDWIISQVATMVLDANVPLGIIPIGDNNKIAAGLGINTNNAADVLGQRRIIKIDLGLVNRYIFLRKAKFYSNNAVIRIDNKYNINARKSWIEIVNFLSPEEEQWNSENKPNPEDNLLYLVIKDRDGGFFSKKEPSQTIIPFEYISIDSKEKEILLDNASTINNPKEVSVLKKRLKVVVGKNRNF